MRAAERPPGRVVALDLGEVRTGVAISDVGGVLARPLQVLDSADLTTYLRELFENEDICEVVVGVPKTLSGEVGEQARRALGVLGRLRAEFPDVRFVEWDERFTTRLAASRAPAKRCKKKGRGPGRRKPVDDLAAAGMLQEYLQAGRGA